MENTGSVAFRASREGAGRTARPLTASTSFKTEVDRQKAVFAKSFGEGKAAVDRILRDGMWSAANSIEQDPKAMPEIRAYTFDALCKTMREAAGKGQGDIVRSVTLTGSPKVREAGLLVSLEFHDHYSVGAVIKQSRGGEENDTLRFRAIAAYAKKPSSTNNERIRMLASLPPSEQKRD
ncbi:MAG: hypothetical protein PHF51_04620 [Candidatus ainarchaeum sp.]|nr:hypothetical protein [Candidatus ainarchaeum sp.]